LPPTAPPANGAWLAAMTRADNVLGIPVFSVILRPLRTSARMSRPNHAAAAKTERSRVSVPGILADTVRQRFLQFRYPGLSPFGLELICFDLRLRVPHEVTSRIASAPAKVQAAVDRLIARYYHRSYERNGLLIQAVHGRREPPLNPAPRGDFARLRNHIRYSETLAPCIEQRWQELDYASFSDYFTGVLRYDLLLLGTQG